LPADTEENTSPSSGGRTKRPPRARGRTAPLTEAERERIRALAREGRSARQIAAEVGRSPTTVSRVAGDLLGERREQTAAATEARSLDLAAERTKLMDQLLRAARGGLGRWVGVQAGDHRGSVDEARAVSALVGAYARLDDRHSRAQGSQGMNDVDAYMAHILGGQPDPALLPSYDDGPE
jgi:hypothetical protein